MMNGLSKLDERLQIESFVRNDGQLTLYAVLVSKESYAGNVLRIDTVPNGEPNSAVDAGRRIFRF